MDDKDRRIEILENRIQFCIDLIRGDFVGEALLELDRVLNDPEMLPPFDEGARLADEPIDSADDRAPF